MDQKERYFSCPNCGEFISIILDLSISGQTYIEDCEVCCRPIEIHYIVRNQEVVEFRAFSGH